MEKDIGKIKKNENTDIIVRIDDFGGKVGLTIREYVSGEKYTGFTKSGTRISAENFREFKRIINSVDENELETMPAETKKFKKQGKKQKTLEKEDKEESEEIKNNVEETEEKIEEENF